MPGFCGCPGLEIEFLRKLGHIYTRTIDGSGIEPDSAPLRSQNEQVQKVEDGYKAAVAGKRMKSIEGLPLIIIWRSFIEREEGRM